MPLHQYIVSVKLKAPHLWQTASSKKNVWKFTFCSSDSTSSQHKYPVEKSKSHSVDKYNPLCCFHFSFEMTWLAVGWTSLSEPFEALDAGWWAAINVFESPHCSGTAYHTKVCLCDLLICECKNWGGRQILMFSKARLGYSVQIGSRIFKILLLQLTSYLRLFPQKHPRDEDLWESDVLGSVPCREVRMQDSEKETKQGCNVKQGPMLAGCPASPTEEDWRPRAPTSIGQGPSQGCMFLGTPHSLCTQAKQTPEAWGQPSHKETWVLDTGSKSKLRAKGHENGKGTQGNRVVHPPWVSPTVTESAPAVSNTMLSIMERREVTRLPSYHP